MRKLSIWLILVLAGCTGIEPSSPTGAEEADAAFSRLGEDYISGYLAWRPQAGTALGFHEFDGRVTDFSRGSIQAELRRLRSFDRRLTRVATNSLNATAYYDYRILRNGIRREIFGFEDLRQYTENPMVYAGAFDVTVYIKRNFAPLEDRARSVIAILNQVPATLGAARENLAASLPRPQVETAIEIANGAADFLAKDLVGALKDIKEGATRSAFVAANDRAVVELRGFAAYLKEQKLPRAHERYGLGRAKYARMLACGEMIAIPPEGLLQTGERELGREQGRFVQAAREIDPTRTPLEVFKAIQKDHPAEQALMADVEKNLEAIRRFLVEHRIVTLPSEARAQVAETPQFMRATSFASMDTPGPFETKAAEAFYYVTPVEKNWPPAQKEEWLTAFNYYTTDVVSIHEAYPGHYTQFLCLNDSPATKIEKIFNSYAFIEGWAHYAEQMMIEEGFGAPPAATGSISDPTHQGAKYWLAQSDEALLRLCRLCVSVKIHCQGMTVDQATRFFQDNCYYEEKPARSEAMRGAFDPEYLYYSLGKLEFLKLREDYRKQEGPGFTLAKFHDEALRHGAPPVRLLREVLLKDRGIWDEVLP